MLLFFDRVLCGGVFFSFVIKSVRAGFRRRPLPSTPPCLSRRAAPLTTSWSCFGDRLATMSADESGVEGLRKGTSHAARAASDASPAAPPGYELPATPYLPLTDAAGTVRGAVFLSVHVHPYSAPRPGRPVNSPRVTEPPGAVGKGFVRASASPRVSYVFYQAQPLPPPLKKSPRPAPLSPRPTLPAAAQAPAPDAQRDSETVATLAPAVPIPVLGSFAVEAEAAGSLSPGAASEWLVPVSPGARAAQSEERLLFNERERMRRNATKSGLQALASVMFGDESNEVRCLPVCVGP
jgi:hypothetical protein